MANAYEGGTSRHVGTGSPRAMRRAAGNIGSQPEVGDHQLTLTADLSPVVWAFTTLGSPLP